MSTICAMAGPSQLYYLFTINCIWATVFLRLEEMLMQGLFIENINFDVHAIAINNYNEHCRYTIQLMCDSLWKMFRYQLLPVYMYNVNWLIPLL